MSFYNNIRRIALLAALALCCGSAWAGAGFWDNNAVKSLVIKVDGTSKTYTWNKTGVSAVSLGEIESFRSLRTK